MVEGEAVRELNRAADALPGSATQELVLQARSGDPGAVAALVNRALPSVKSWARGRLPRAARAAFDTEDLVQEAALHVIERRAAFDARHGGAMRAYLRRCVINRIRDEMRRVSRRPTEELGDWVAADGTGQVDMVIKLENGQRYRAALGRLRTKDRELIRARIEAHATFAEIADRFGLKTAGAARMAVGRALGRLAGHAAATPSPLARRPGDAATMAAAREKFLMEKSRRRRAPAAA
jgi:RNA polymerase sigma-70 factor (ECF subfamily)